MQTTLDSGPPAHLTQADRDLVNTVTGLLENKRFRFTSEDDLQQGIEKVLAAGNIPFEREKVLSVRDRPDFLVDGRLAIEVKIKGTLAQALRQVGRYTEHPDIQSILLVGSPHWLRDVPPTINNKPIYAMRLTSSLL